MCCQLRHMKITITKDANMDFSNKVKRAVMRLGGPTKTAIHMECSGTTIQSWIRQGKVKNIDKAKKLADLAGMDLKEIRPCR